jgi:hypothetical protein
MIAAGNETFGGVTRGHFRPRGCALYRRNDIKWKRGTDEMSVCNAEQK